MEKDLRREYFDKAFKLHNNGKLDEAKTLYKKILNDLPQDYEVLNLLGMCELAQKNYQVAQKYVVEAIKIRPLRYFFDTLAKIYSLQSLFKDELEILLQEEKFFNLDFDLAFSLGLCYKNLRDFENSQKYYLKAIELNPKSRDAYMNLSIVYLAVHNPQMAKWCYERCLELNPDDTEANYFLGICYFRLKNYEKGMPYFESRLCRKSAVETTKFNYPNLTANAKIWSGEDISDKILYTYYEAGFGDMIMFSRYIPLLLNRCKKLIIKPQVALYQLFQDNFKQAEVMNYFYQESEFYFDYHIPFLSIPYVLNLTNEQMFTSRSGYLKAAPDKIDFFKNKYFNNNKLKIGIKWRGNTYYETDRVINVEAFFKLFQLQNVQVYNAQTFEGSEELEKITTRFDIIDLTADFNDFSYTAGAIENLDLIICNDTSLLHIAGAMHKPCYVLLPYNTNWRWHTDLNYCDWYETVNLYGAQKEETWTDVMDRIITDIKKDFLIK